MLREEEEELLVVVVVVDDAVVVEFASFSCGTIVVRFKVDDVVAVG